MITLAGQSLCVLQFQKTGFPRDGRSQFKFNPLPPNSVSCPTSRFKFNHLPLTSDRASRRSPISGFSVLAATGNFSNTSQLSSSVGPPLSVRVPLKPDGLFLICVLVAAAYHIVTGVIGVVKFVSDHLSYARQLRQTARKTLENKIPPDTEGKSISCSD